MTRYEWRYFPLDEDRGFDTKVRIVDVLDTPTTHESGTYALVVVDEAPDIPATFSDDPEGIADDGENALTCSGTKSDDSPCTREVDEEGDRCWQHPIGDS